MKPDTTDQLCVNTIRTLAIDMIFWPSFPVPFGAMQPFSSIKVAYEDLAYCASNKEA